MALSATDQFWGLAYTSWHQRENLVAAMLHGRKETAQPGDAD